MSGFYIYFFMIARWLIALCSIGLVAAWIHCFIKTKHHRMPLAALVTSDGISLDITVTENIIGRSSSADITLPIRGVHKRHAILSFKNHHWILAPLEGKVAINLQNVRRPAPLEYGDNITIAGQTLTFKYKDSENISSSSEPNGFLPMFLLTLFQILICTSVSLRFIEGLNTLIPIAFLALVFGEWCWFIINQFIKNAKMLLEIPVLYLSTLGLAVCACSMPEQLFKQIICYIVGFMGFVLLTILLKYRDFWIKIQRIIMVLSLLLLYYTAFFGSKINSSRNWLKIASFSFQPSELCKVAFVLSGAITLYLLNKNKFRRFEFLIYSVLCMGALAIMLDFGAVAIFFIGLMVILTLRGEHPLILGGIFGGAVVGILGIIWLYPYVARRFSVWLHAWEFAGSTGYQQTRTMMSFASGGLLGVGGGNGHLNQIPAAETDLVYGIIGEEWGAIVALTTAFFIVAICLYGCQLVRQSTCVFDTVTVGGSVAMLIFQSALNIFGSVDMLPLTGVTLIFVSVGGTSLISAFFMLAFFKSAEIHRQSVVQWRDSEDE
ncbi:MAG: FtsW/RodA/SpoVE family cell cycle protein [Clostridia bacterium]|nr:FtsW/RodA/SpoVE family cell cycle protein [Clostridia bacterium]